MGNLPKPKSKVVIKLNQNTYEINDFDKVRHQSTKDS